MDYQKSSNKKWYIIGIIVIAALAFWYFSARTPSTSTAPTATEQAQPAATNNSVSAITSDLNQIPDDTATLNQASASSAAAVQGL